MHMSWVSRQKPGWDGCEARQRCSRLLQVTFSFSWQQKREISDEICEHFQAMFVGGKTRHSQPKHAIRTLTKSFLCLNQKNLNSRPEALHFYNIKMENWSVKACQNLCGLQERIVLTLILVMGLVSGISCWGFLICTLGNLESCVETQFLAFLPPHSPDALCSILPCTACHHFTYKPADYCTFFSQTYTQTHRTPAVEMIASQYEQAEGI